MYGITGEDQLTAMKYLFMLFTYRLLISFFSLLSQCFGPHQAYGDPGNQYGISQHSSTVRLGLRLQVLKLVCEFGYIVIVSSIPKCIWTQWKRGDQ